MKKDLKKLILRGTAFLLPLLFIWPAAVHRSGEMVKPETVIQRQIDNTSLLFGPSFRSSYYFYRAEATRVIQPELLVLGDSRAGTLRSFFFDSPEAVYNACWGVINPADALPFMESITGDSIRTVLISLSHFDFNAAYIDVDYRDKEEFSNPGLGGTVDFAGASGFMLDAWKGGRLSLFGMVFHGKNQLGAGAILTGNGILSDGSYYSATDYEGRAPRMYTEEHLRDALLRIEEESGRFQAGDNINPASLEQLGAFLEFCADSNIQVIAFLPPYSPSVNAAMCDKDEVYGYHYALPAILNALFDEYSEYGFEFYDYTDVSGLGCDDSYFLDGFHGGDIVTLRMLGDMMAKGSAISQWCSEETLKGLEEQRYADYLLFETLEEYTSRMPKYTV